VCLDAARASSFGTKRAFLIDMAQTWLQLAEEEQKAAIPPVAAEQPRPVVQQQQQQQIQPKDTKK
jgi:hypothetical protein